jgi:hypothetical protein
MAGKRRNLLQNVLNALDFDESEEIYDFGIQKRAYKRQKSLIVVSSLIEYYPMFLGKLTLPRLPNVNRTEQRKYARRFIQTWSNDMFRRQFRLCR